MMRPLLLWASTNPWASERLPRYGFVRRAVRRFMPGEHPEDALREVERLKAAGSATILTLLGENVQERAEADEVAAHYHRLLAEVQRRGLDAEVSVKLTQLGVDQSPELALSHVRELAEASRGAGPDGSPGRPLTLWIDMESSAYVERTLEIFRAARTEHENVGLALQAYLHRTEADLEALLPLKPIIRLVKGAYLEPASLALTRKADVDRSFHRLARRLLQERKAGRAGRPSLATHDPRLVGEITRLAREIDLPRDAWEFAMLYGIDTGQQERLVDQGYRMRVLISYGEAWFPWYMRRLAERPANVWFVVKQMMNRG